MTSTLQTVLRTNVPRPTRYDAIDSLAETNEATELAILVRMDSLQGEYRRYAVKALARCNAESVLAEIAADSTVDASLRRQADRLA